MENNAIFYTSFSVSRGRGNSPTSHPCGAPAYLSSQLRAFAFANWGINRVKFSALIPHTEKYFCKIFILRDIEASFHSIVNDSSVGRGERRNVPPPPEIGKIVVEIWCYLPEVNTFWLESEIHEILSKKLWKSQFTIEILMKKSQNFLEISKILVIFCPNAQSFAGQLLSFTWPIEIVIRSRWSCIVL